MNFSAYAQMLYLCIGDEMKTHEFVFNLVSQIMDSTFLDKDFKNHPLANLTENTLSKYYGGSASMSRKTVRTILCNIDIDKFKGYLSGFSNDTIDLIQKEMCLNGIPIVDNDVIDTCTNLFISVLKDRTSGAKNNIPTPSEDEIEKDDKPHKQMISVFNEAYDRYYINDFLEANPSASILGISKRNTEWVSLSTDFIESIKTDLITPFSSYKSELAYINITRFIALLNEYTSFFLREPSLVLPPVSRKALGYTSILEQIETELNFSTGQEMRVANSIEYYRDKLKELFNLVCKDNVQSSRRLPIN